VPRLTVGFDLDLTLIDSRPGIAATLDALAAETGTVIDSAAAVTRLGPPLAEELARWYPAADVEPMADRFRALYPDLAIGVSTALPGAHEALAVVRAHEGRSIVVTAKYAPNARMHLEHLGLDVDEVIGWRHGAEKGQALAEHGATVYVGDHVADIAGARAAGAVAVAVATGPISAADLAASDADAVLDSLLDFPAWLDRYVLDARLADLQRQMRSLDSVVVAFSGGADSAFLLAAAVRALGPDRVLAATAVSGSLPASELAGAAEFAADLGVEHVTPQTREIERDGYRANAGNRCYFCKSELLDVLVPLAAARGFAAVATGTNADDARSDFRPGIRAAAERGAVTPLRAAGLTKAQVRAASREWGLRTWDKPAAACLSSRIAYGLEISPARLARVEHAEAALRSVLAAARIPVRDLRVRDVGDLARVEVDLEHVPAVAACAPALDAVRAAGFAEVEVDPRGFRSGSMNERLADPDRFR